MLRFQYSTKAGEGRQFLWALGKRGCYNIAMRATKQWRWLTIGAVALAVAWKAAWLWQRAFPFNADEAVVGLMARHILQGERPTFFYGQAYMGSLDAFLVAGGFALFGARVWVIRLVQALLYAGTVVLTACVAGRLFGSGKAAAATALLMALPTVNMTLYTTVSLGGYGEALLLGTASLCVALSGWGSRRRGAFVWGLLAGVGLWAFGLVLIYVLPAGAFLLWRMRKAARRDTATWAAIAALSGLAGAWPWWLYGVRHGWRALVAELLGSAIAVQQGPYVVQVARHALYFVLLGLPVTLGLRPPWDVHLLVWPLGVGVAAIYVAGAWQLWQKRRALPPAAWLPLGVAAAVTAGFLLTPFGNDPSGRYFLPLTQMAFVGLGGWLAALRWRGKPIGWMLLGLVLLFHAVGTAQAAANPYRLTTQFAPDARVRPDYESQLMAFLEAHGGNRGYTTYWVAYPLAFLSNEQIILVPRLPYHEDLRYTPRDDRYAPYDAAVAAAPRVVYVTVAHPRLEDCLRAAFRRQGVAWQEAVIGDYRVFYDLSRKIAPDGALAACGGEVR